MPVKKLLALTVSALLVALVASALPATATVPPTDCGLMRVKGKRYNIKTHSITCRRAKPWTKRYLTTGRRPRGYRCRNYDPKVTKFRFRCARRDRDFFAIRR